MKMTLFPADPTLHLPRGRSVALHHCQDIVRSFFSAVLVAVNTISSRNLCAATDLPQADRWSLRVYIRELNNAALTGANLIKPLIFHHILLF